MKMQNLGVQSIMRREEEEEEEEEEKEKLMQCFRNDISVPEHKT